MTRPSLGFLAILLLLSACGGPSSEVKRKEDETKERREKTKERTETIEKASSYVPKLLKAMNDPDPEVRWRAEFGLGRADADGIEALAEALEDESPKIRFNAAYVLGPHAKRAKKAVPALIKALSDTDAAVRRWAVKSLADIDPMHPDVVAAFTRALRDPETDVRRVALLGLVKIGAMATGAAQPLVDVLQDADAGVRARACMVFREIGSDSKVGIPGLIAHLSDPDGEVRFRAAEALSRIGAVALDPLVRALKERDPNARRGAAEVIGSFGTDARMSAPDLGELAKDPDPSVRKAAADAVRRVQTETAGTGGNRGTTFIDAPETIKRRADAYRWTKVGLMVHWGLYSVPARARTGQQAELVMQNEKVPIREYEHFALSFSAENFKAEEWAKLANEAGARYMVLTAKHHDGFCLWNSKLTEYTSNRLAAARRDLLGELVKACEKESVKLHAYYSLLDWHHPDYESNFPKYLEYAHGQVKELLAYPIAGLWLDGEWGHTWDEWKSDELLTYIRQTKPLVLVNDRWGRDTRATMQSVDFYSQEPEATAAALRLQNRPLTWEKAMSFGDSWGYSESPEPLKSGERMILEMVEAVSKGGNFVMNVGARRDGTIPAPVAERLRVVGSWLRKNGTAIYETERGPFNGPIPAGRVAMKENRLYVFLEQLPKGGIITLPKLKTKVREAWVVDGRIGLNVRENGVDAPGEMTEGPVTVVAIELEGPVEFTK